MNKILVLTAIAGKKDALRDPSVVFDNCDYIAFVEEINPNIKIWKQQKLLPFSSLDRFAPRRNAKIYKILSTWLFPTYSYIVWTDGNHQPIVDPHKIIQDYGDADMYIFRHPGRLCAYQEMLEVVRAKKEDLPIIEQQIKFYKQQGFPEMLGLAEMTTFIKKNTEAVKMLEASWWEQICKFSSRDQCSFTYCLWLLKNQQTDIKIKFLRGAANKVCGGNIYFDEQPHLFEEHI
jgi:hypothetical protein